MARPYCVSVLLPVAAVPARRNVVPAPCVMYLVVPLLLYTVTACPNGLVNTLAGTVTLPELILTKFPLSLAVNVYAPPWVLIGMLLNRPFASETLPENVGLFATATVIVSVTLLEVITILLPGVTVNTPAVLVANKLVPFAVTVWNALSPVS